MRKIGLTKQNFRIVRQALTYASGTIKREIETGTSKLYLTTDNKLYVVLRFEGSELVIVAVAGKELFKNRREIINFAKLNNFMTIRFHTFFKNRIEHAFRGLDISLIDTRKVFFKKEYIYRWAVNYGG